MRETTPARVDNSLGSIPSDHPEQEGVEEMADQGDTQNRAEACRFARELKNQVPAPGGGNKQQAIQRQRGHTPDKLHVSQGFGQQAKLQTSKNRPEQPCGNQNGEQAHENGPLLSKHHPRNFALSL